MGLTWRICNGLSSPSTEDRSTDNDAILLEVRGATSSIGRLAGQATCQNEHQKTLTATPATGSRFAGWSSDADCADGAVTMGASVSCTATFTRVDTLTLTKSGEGAAESTVTSSPTGVSCGSTCAASYDTGTSVTLTADWAEGYDFLGWSGTGCSAGTTSVTVSMTQARSCTATFVALPPPGCGPEDESACLRDGGSWDPLSCTCGNLWMDPLVIPLDGHHVRLTGVADGVAFDVNGDGVLDRVGWTVPGADVGLFRDGR